MADLIWDGGLISAGEPYFLAHIARADGRSQTIVASLTTGLIGPVDALQIEPRRLSSFELPALELLSKAHDRAAEMGVHKILIVDPQGWLPLAKINRYVRN